MVPATNPSQVMWRDIIATKRIHSVPRELQEVVSILYPEVHPGKVNSNTSENQQKSVNQHTPSNQSTSPPARQPAYQPGNQFTNLQPDNQPTSQVTSLPAYQPGNQSTSPPAR